VLALLLAATGVYSVVAYSVACRRREMGVRMALGATRERIFLMVLREENLTTLLGLAFGLLAADWGLKFVSETIFSTSPQQQMIVMIAATIGMFAVAIFAAGVPGARAARVSPAEALRTD
jgi:putative ABC transport system permease protein